MALDSSLCDIIKRIQKDPFKKVEGLTVGKFYQLQEHLKKCEDCIRVTDEILEKHKDVPKDSNNGWEQTKYN